MEEMLDDMPSLVSLTAKVFYASKKEKLLWIVYQNA